MSWPSEPTLLLLAALASGLLGGLALYGLTALGRTRRGAERLAGTLASLRRHPLVGEIPQEPNGALAPALREMAHLVEDLRSQVGASQARTASLRALADGPSDVAIIALDADWQVVHFSRGAVLLTGWNSEDITGQHVEALFAPGEWERILPKLARRSLRSEGFSDTLRLRRRDGAVLPCRVSAGPGGNGEGSGTLLHARDLSQEQELEKRLRFSEERHRRLVEELQDGVGILQAGRIAYANRTLARLFGVDPEGARGRPFKDLIDARDLLRVLEELSRAERGEGESGEIFCRLSAAGQASIDARLAWSVTEHQGRRAVFMTLADLTARSRHEAALAESEARLRATLQAAGDGILVLGESGPGLAVTLVNRPFCELFGLSEADLLGQPLAAACRRLAESGGGDLEALLTAARSGQAGRRDGYEISSPRRSIAELYVAPVRSRTGRSLGVILTARDLTVHIDSDRRLRTSLDELTAAQGQLETSLRDLGVARATLEERNVQLERLNTELRSLDEMKSSLLANVSHELHTPLVSIKGYTEMILKRKLGPLTPEQERGLAVALKNIDRLIELIDNLLSFARMETGETQLTLEDLPLWQLVDEAVDLVSERITRRNLSVTTQYEADDLMVRGDRVKLGQVFTNLLTNAVKFNREGGRIDIAARRAAGGFVEVEISDTGIGIPPGEQEKIFERFYQVESGPRRHYEGTGIGLSIVRDILRLHGCSIRVESRTDEGATFHFTLPLGRGTHPSETRPQTGRGRNRA